MVVCSLLGVMIERFAYRPLRKAPKLNSLITAIGVSLFLQYAGQIVFGADPKVFPNILEDVTLASFGDVNLQLFDVTILAVGLIFMAGLTYLIHYTKTGKAMRAVSNNQVVASLMGINSNKVIAMTFIIGSSLAGVHWFKSLHRSCAGRYRQSRRRCSRRHYYGPQRRIRGRLFIEYLPRCCGVCDFNCDLVISPLWAFG